MLFVSKPYRLSRVVAKIAGLIRGGTELRVVECANASTLGLHIRAVIAEEERRKIGERTRDALARAIGMVARIAAPKAGSLPPPKPPPTVASCGPTPYSLALPIAQQLRVNGSSLRALADRLNIDGITNPRGSNGQAAQVQRLLASGVWGMPGWGKAPTYEYPSVAATRPTFNSFRRLLPATIPARCRTHSRRARED